MFNQHYLWVEKYRPKSIKDTILPKELKEIFQNIVKSGHIGNYTFSGPKGTGKTTSAKALAKELNYDVLFLNASEEGNIDTLRTQIKPFASTVSLNSTRKLVILDEADGLTSTAQPALRGLIEDFSKNCSFILTANYKNKIIPALHSRCPVIEFSVPRDEKKDLAIKFLKRILEILDLEKIEYDKKVVGELIQRYFPDYRRVLGELQKYSLAGKIDSGILNQFADIKLSDLVKYMKDKDFNKMSDWVASNSNNDSVVLFREIYDAFEKFLKKDSVPQFILILADFQFKASFSVDPEINLRAFLTQCMSDLEWK